MTTPTSVEGTLLARLGLHPTASAQEVEAAHDGLVDYLEGAPADLRTWARVQIGSIDEAFALLSDPTIDRSALVAPTPGPIKTAPPAAKSKPAPLPDPLDDDELIAQFTTDPTTATAPGKKARPRTGSAVVASATSAAPVQSRRPLARRIAVFGVVVVGVVAIAIAGFNLNGGTGVPAINGTPAPEARGKRRRRCGPGRGTHDQGQRRPEGHDLAPVARGHLLRRRRLRECRRLPGEGHRRRPEERHREDRPRRGVVQPGQIGWCRGAVASRHRRRAEQPRSPLRPRVHVPEQDPSGSRQRQGRMGQGHDHRARLRRRQDRGHAPRQPRRLTGAECGTAGRAALLSSEPAPAVSPAASPAASGK